MSATFTSGKHAGKLVSEVDSSYLSWCAENLKNESLREACVAELATRNGGEAQAPRAATPSASRAVQRSSASTALVEGSFSDPGQITEALRKAAENYHLVSPSTVCGNLPEGCEVALSLVHVNPDDPNLYPLSGGKLGLDRVTLQQIASAAGATMVRSHRLDDGSHPHYCAWFAEIAYRMFDGQVVHRQGSVEIDVREPDGAAYVEILEKAKNSKGGPRSPDKQLLELRKFLTRHAESKALNRAIANMGIRRSYTRAELAKPFAVARVMFTGRSADPDASRQFRDKIADSFLGGTRQLYGGAPAQAPRQIVEHAPQPPPPQGGYGDDDLPEDY